MITHEILILLSPSGFIERFHYYCRYEKTNIKAYEQVEKEFESYYGKRRYSSYDSFRVVMSRRLNK
tara:strand:- start:1775 stop:1972 length:198 start_codon:yes stop_codon:yes gene_type:complete